VGSSDFDFTRVLHRPFNPAAKIVFYSDGLFDQRPHDSTCLEKKSIQSQLHSWFQSKRETEHVVSQLMETTRQFFGSTPPDDVTVVIMERT
jgi:serine phosphatase RsbU (regulator of sigma subunit)